MGILNNLGTTTTTTVPFNGAPHVGLHGLLESHLAASLFWLPAHEVSLSRRRHRTTGIHGRFPTWAWAGWVGPVAYDVDNETEFFSQTLHYRTGKHKTRVLYLTLFITNLVGKRPDSWIFWPRKLKSQPYDEGGCIPYYWHV